MLVAHFRSVCNEGSDILIMFLRYLYAFGLMHLNNIALAMSSVDQIMRFREGFKSIRICPGVNILFKILYIFVSYFLLSLD